MKTSLLLAFSKFRGEDHGWIPVSTLHWLRQHHDSRMPPPGTRVWMGGLSTFEIPASVQAACLYDADREPTAPSSAPHRWPPHAVFGAGDRDALAGRLRRGLPARP